MDEFAQLFGQTRCQCGRVFVSDERAPDRAVVVDEPPLPECFELGALLDGFRAPRRIISQGRLSEAAVHHQVRPAQAFAGLGGSDDFPFRAAFETRAVPAQKLRRHPRTEARPEKGEYDVAVRRRDNLFVEMGHRTRRLVFPENRFETDKIPVVALEPFDDPAHDLALGLHVTRR